MLDVPEAIWSNLGLTYLAHTHVPTLWTERGITLERLEWSHRDDGSLVMERTLPNGITFGTRAVPKADHVALEQWLTNGTDRPLSDLRVQDCVLLKGAKGFNAQTDDNKLVRKPYVACRSTDGRRWIISAWEPCQRAWSNPPCPCLHSDPQFPDCAPGQTVRVRGLLSFHEGDNIEAELKRLDRTGGAAKERNRASLRPRLDPTRRVGNVTERPTRTQRRRSNRAPADPGDQQDHQKAGHPEHQRRMATGDVPEPRIEPRRFRPKAHRDSPAWEPSPEVRPEPESGPRIAPGLFEDKDKGRSTFRAGLLLASLGRELR